MAMPLGLVYASVDVVGGIFTWHLWEEDIARVTHSVTKGIRCLSMLVLSTHCQLAGVLWLICLACYGNVSDIG